MATLSVLYFFDVKEDQEQVFIENWIKLTALIYEYQGSLGSRLHKTEDGRYYRYAMWPNKELWEQDWSNMPHEANKYSDAMSGACATPFDRKPWIDGGYAYCRYGTGNQRQALAEPIEDRIFFAGEACSLDEPGTAHGAWLSGGKAIEQIAELQS
jgi:hypothetical protein